MLSHIKAVLNPDQITECLATLQRAPWIDGRHSAGPMAASAKRNMEADLTNAEVRNWSDRIQAILKGHPEFIAQAFPAKICPPSFNRHEKGQTYGDHSDAGLFDFNGIGQGWLRADLAATLFLSVPGDYDGGELVIEDTLSVSRIKLPPGDMILYPASSLHRVEPVTRGARIASYFWIQSLIRDNAQRGLLHDLDGAIRQLGAAAPESATARKLVGLYHNLLRMWSDT